MALDLRIYRLERVTGIEPALSAWEADVLPLNYTRVHGVGRTCRAACSDIVPDGRGTLRFPAVVEAAMRHCESVQERADDGASRRG